MIQVNLVSIWMVLLLFEIVLFSSYTVIMYIFSKKKERPVEIGHLPDITMIIPMYNEEKIIKEKIENTSQLDYPADKLNIILLDDHSTDNSKNISLKTIKEKSLNAQVIESRGGKGKARALNWLFPSLESELTVITDADALLKEDSLLQISKNYTYPDIGGVTGKIVIISDRSRPSKSQEDSYRFYFDIWRRGESKIFSVSVCNGPLMSFRTCLLKTMKIDPDAYADDSDLLFKTIRSGYRVVYEPNAIVFERVPQTMKGRLVQKMKRINGLRKVYLRNLGLLGKGYFGLIIYPFALLTHMVSPLVILVMVLLYPLIILQNIFYLYIMALLVIPGVRKMLLSFIITQFVMNFSFLIPTSGSWEAIEDARYSLENKH